MGTTYSVRAVIKRELPNQLKNLQKEVDSLLAEVNRQMSTYDPQSELSRFNQAPAEKWVPVSTELLHIIDDAQSISDATKGAFDVTVGPVVNLWKFGPDKDRKHFPTDQEIAEAKKLVGYQQVKTHYELLAVQKSQGNVYVDLSAIAKGYGVDVVFQLLKERGLTDFMVEIGGEVRATGLKPNGEPWQIGIELPTEKAGEYDEIVGLHDKALATSGDYRNFFMHEGERYSHTINPLTGRPVEHDLASVSVLHDRCAMADGWATALLVLGPDAGYNLAEQQKLAAFFQIRKEDGTVESKSTTAWQQYQLD
ncbi:FAD:protein FMN transferase [Bremerella cremea]|uniref:FAD:protein FMN transferase n=2 Tax=Bremerella cremea TaxID=1031537 RepID=A0A368KRT9_9BACT|nr:FAD:protein FMN transferase [Bremerella cremea]